MKSSTYQFSFDGKLLQRGFWLYVWEITPPEGGKVYYVGRTGDSSSCNAQSPFNRMGQHFGFNTRSNVLRKRLDAEGIVPEQCDFRMIAHGIILEEADNMDEHRKRRDVVAALEKSLSDALSDSGYAVLNEVNCCQPLDKPMWEEIRIAFAAEFPMLGKTDAEA